MPEDDPSNGLLKGDPRLPELKWDVKNRFIDPLEEEIWERRGDRYFWIGKMED